MLNEPSTEIATKKNKGSLRLVVGCILSAGCLYFVFRNIKLNEVLLALSEFRWPYLVIGIVLLAIGYTARIARWRMLLEACGPRVTLRACASPFLASIALNNVLPFRVGDVVRALVFPATLGVTKTSATATLVLERLVDLLTLLLCLALAASFFPKGALPTPIIDAVVTLAILGCAALLCLMLLTGLVIRAIRSLARQLEDKADGRIGDILEAAAELGQALKSISRFRTVVAAIAISFIAWAGELGLYLMLMQGAGMAFSLPGGLLLMSMATIATLAPSSPGYVGPYHLAAFTAVHLMGGPSAQAMTMAV
ncbi:MAG TPA: lysylphosphatidylglycerol synthase transmembrane domain-containing protein, partial [Dyella sp.]|uniref:lysylphosphatidylglycerol synthase transmembrane domain-containing protein n=1 Tax=Dyella sp. TaxID=1869338 RepID=UPI002F92BA1D